MTGVALKVANYKLNSDSIPACAVALCRSLVVVPVHPAHTHTHDTHIVSRSLATCPYHPKTLALSNPRDSHATHHLTKPSCSLSVHMLSWDMLACAVVSKQPISSLIILGQVGELDGRLINSVDAVR